MTWTKLSDDFGDDCWTLSDAAFRLHTEALVWNGRKLFDCVIPQDDLRRFAKRPEAVAELLHAGYWVTGTAVDESGATIAVYRIVHHSGYQRGRAEVIAQQEANRENGRKGGRPPKSGRPLSAAPKTQSVSESLDESRTERDRTGQGRALEVEQNQNEGDEAEPPNSVPIQAAVDPVEDRQPDDDPSVPEQSEAERITAEFWKDSPTPEYVPPPPTDPFGPMPLSLDSSRRVSPASWTTSVEKERSEQNHRAAARARAARARRERTEGGYNQ